MNKLEEAKIILKKLDLPKAQQNNRSAYTLLALLGLEEDDDWSNSGQNLMGIHDIIVFIKDNYDFEYAENSRESIRRRTIHQFMDAMIIEKNADDPSRPTNSGNTVYSIIPEVLDVFTTFGTDEWEDSINNFFEEYESLNEKYTKKREMHKIPVKIEDKEIQFSPGEHNELQKLIIEDFGSRFAKGAKLLYVGDTADKSLYKLNKTMKELGIPTSKHDKLPDVILYNEDKNWLFLCEAVTSHGPISEKRYIELEKMLENCNTKNIFCTCFLDKKTYRK
ncbi:MAG: BsuBI/PstI family type II restriction endonuclease [Bacillota bacterium]